MSVLLSTQPGDRTLEKDDDAIESIADNLSIKEVIAQIIDLYQQT